MTPWTFDIKFPRGTEFTFGSLTFAVGEDGDLRMLPPGRRQNISLLRLHQLRLRRSQISFMGRISVRSNSSERSRS
jgi:hypothetical protein